MATDPTTDDSGSEDIDDIEVELDGDDGAQNDPDDSDGEDPAAGDKVPSNDDADADDADADDTPAFDDDLDAWAVKAGHDAPENDRERKLLQGIRNGSREFTREQQAKAQRGLNKAVKDNVPKVSDDEIIDPLEKRVLAAEARLEQESRTRLMSEYISQNPISAEEGVAMEEILKEAAEAGRETTVNHYAEDIAAWHIAGKARVASSTDSNAEAVAKAKQEEREKLAKESKSGGVKRSASGRPPTSKKGIVEQTNEIFADL